MKVAIIGGGPAGLFFACLLKKSRPDDDIRIFEQNPYNATYGFGVTLAGAARDRLRAADPEVPDRLEAAMVFNAGQDIALDGTRIRLTYAESGGALPRLSLLNILEDVCRKAGLAVDHTRRIESAEELAGYDLVVGADGANSAVRALHEDGFGVRRRTLSNRFAWYGVNKALAPNALVFRNVEGRVYVAHYYAYSSDMSTFVAECDGETWDRHGLAEMTDAERKALFEKVFEAELGGFPLVENKSSWRQFQAITNDRWHVGNMVLIGDALRVAHFSIGSGTRLAMDDAVALNTAIGSSGGDVRSALARFVELRKPSRDLFTDATVRSFEWYENVRAAMRAGPIDFTYDFLTRTGRIDDDRLKSYVPSFYEQYAAHRQSLKPTPVGA